MNNLLLAAAGTVIIVLSGATAYLRFEVSGLEKENASLTAKLRQQTQRAQVAEANAALQARALSEQNAKILRMKMDADKRLAAAEDRVRAAEKWAEDEKRKSNSIPGHGPEAMNPWLRNFVLDQ